MKQHFSILAIAARSTLPKITGLLLLMAGVQGAAFYHLLKKASFGELYTLESLINQSRIPVICGVTFLLIHGLLCLVGYEFSGSKTSYTLQRLSISEKVTVLLWSLYNLLCLVIFWAAQLLIVLLLSRLYLALMEPAHWNNQTVFLAFYRNPFLHSLLPLEETSRWIRNGLFIMALSLVSASFHLRQRRRKKGIAAVVLAFISVVTFPREIGRFESDLLLMLVALAVIFNSIYDLWRGKSHEA